MKKKLTKMIVLAMVLSMAFSATAFAADAKSVNYQSYSRSYSDNFSKTYWDNFGVSHTVSGTATCQATVEWDEGYAGWIVTAYFPKPSATIDGASTGVDYSGVTHISGSTAYQDFNINSSGNIVRSLVWCDEYGDSDFSASFR